MSFIINVAKARNRFLGTVPEHVFRTAEDSILYLERALEVALMLRKAFPQAKYEMDHGYEITITEVVKTGISIPYSEQQV